MDDLYLLPTAQPITRFQAARPPGAQEPHRWMSIAAAFVDTGGLIGGDELADLIRQQALRDAQLQISQPVSLVARWIVSGMVLSMDSPWGIVLPLFQFNVQCGTLRPEVPIICAELGGVLKGPALALWFVTPNEWLEGEKPALALGARLLEVRRAARHVADGA